MKLSEILASNRVRLLLVAIFLALFATILVTTFVQKEIYKETGGKKTMIVSVVKPIGQYEFIKPGDLGVTEFPSMFLDARFIPAEELPNLVSLQVGNALLPKQILMWSDIVLTLRKSLSDHINMNERVITLPVNMTNSFNNMIEPGDRVDVIFVEKGSTLAKGSSARVLLQDVYVMATNNNLRRRISGSYVTMGGDVTNAQQQATNVSTISLRLPAADALLVAYAESDGRLIFLLRNRFDVFTSTYETLRATNVEDEIVGMEQGVDRFGLPLNVKDYPVIYTEGKPKHSGYYPGHTTTEKAMQEFAPSTFERRLGDKSLQESQ